MASPTLRSIERFSQLLFIVASYQPGQTPAIPVADRPLLHQLKLSGLVTFTTYMSGELDDLQITPTGALALVQWRDLLNAKSFGGILLNTSEKVLYLFLGAALSAVGSIVQATILST